MPDRPPRPRLAGFVLAILGISTWCTTSPFGLMLSAEKFFERDRPPRLKVYDRIGVVLGALGCLWLPFTFIAAWIWIGPVQVLLYLAFLAGWTWHRVRVVWGWPAARSRDEHTPDADD